MKTVAADIEFSYEDDVTEKDLRSIVKKVETFRKNCEYSSTVSFFLSRNTIQVVITFLDVDHKVYDKLRYPLNRLIDTHKQPATYGWSLEVSDLMTQIKVGA